VRLRAAGWPPWEQRALRQSGSVHTQVGFSPRRSATRFTGALVPRISLGPASQMFWRRKQPGLALAGQAPGGCICKGGPPFRLAEFTAKRAASRPAEQVLVSCGRLLRSFWAGRWDRLATGRTGVLDRRCICTSVFCALGRVLVGGALSAEPSKQIGLEPDRQLEQTRGLMNPAAPP